MAHIPSKKRNRAGTILNNRHLPPHLIEEILLNLPHKSLVRFSTVSKSWNSMIFDPVFARKHKNRAALLRRHSLVVYMNKRYEAAAVCFLTPISSDLRIKVISKGSVSSDGSDPFFSVLSNAKAGVRDFVGQFERHPHLRAYCDELWCVQVKKSLYLWNPSIRNIVKLPRPSSFESRADYIYGLAYDSVNDDYKILKIKRHPPFETELYSLKNNCWTKIKHFTSGVQAFSQERCEFVGGRFHWIGYTTAEAPIIVSFDLSTEKYGVVALPHEYDDDKGYCNELEVVTLNGKLCVYVNYEEPRFVLWVMEEYGDEKSWTKRFDIMLPQPPMLGDNCSSPEKLTPLYLSDNNNDLLVKIQGCCARDMYILMYRNGEAKPKKIVKYENWRFYDEVDAFLYVESLITHRNFPKNR